MDDEETAVVALVRIFKEICLLLKKRKPIKLLEIGDTTQIELAKLR